MRRLLRRLSCWWAGHEPEPWTWLGADGIERGACRFCGIEIARVVEQPVTGGARKAADASRRPTTGPGVERG